MSECKRGCCWTPVQVCARRRACRCHTQEPKAGHTLDDLLAEAARLEGQHQ